MSERYTPGLIDAHNALHTQRQLDYRKNTLYDASEHSQNQLKQDTTPAESIIVIKQKKALGMPLSAMEGMIVNALSKPRSELPKAG